MRPQQLAMKPGTPSAIAGLVLVVSACTTRNRAMNESPMESTPTPDRIEIGEGVHRVPFQLAHGRPIPTVKVLVNGRGPYTFLCDIGASVNVLDVELAHSLGLALGSPEPLRDPFGAPHVQAWKAQLDTLQIGDVKWGGVPVVATNHRSFDIGHNIQGVLGLPLFEGCLVTIDYPNQELAMERGSLAESIDSDVVQYDARGPLPEIPLVVGGHTIPASIDSGSASGFTLPRRLAIDLGVESEPRVVGRGRTSDGEFEVWASKLRDSIILGGHEYRSPEVRLNDRFPTTNIGHGVLQDFAVTIDPAHDRMRLMFRIPLSER
jgi:hypothetical protein